MSIEDTTVPALPEASQAANQARTRFTEPGRELYGGDETFRRTPPRNDNRGAAMAEAVANTVAALRRSTTNASEKVNAVAQTVTEAYQSTARYLRHHDFNDMTADIEKNVRKNPNAWLIGAAAAGLLLGVALRRRD